MEKTKWYRRKVEVNALGFYMILAGFFALSWGSYFMRQDDRKWAQCIDAQNPVCEVGNYRFEIAYTANGWRAQGVRND